jgi:hypothetical protein
VATNNPFYSSVNGVLFDKRQDTLLQYPGGLGGSYTIPASVASIRDLAFCDCTSLTSVTILGSVTSIGDFVFDFCTSLTSVTIPNSVTSIGEAAFEVCTSLTSVTIPASVTSIGYSAFGQCYSLTGVTIGNGVTSIGSDAFYECTKLTSVYFQGNAPGAGNDSTVFEYDNNPIAYYQAGTTGWGPTFDGIPTMELFPSYPPPLAGTAYYSRPANISLKIAISDLFTNVSVAQGDYVTLVGVGTDGLNLLSTNGTTLFTNSTYILYTNSVTPNVNDSFNYTVSDLLGQTSIGTVLIIMNNNIVGQANVNLNVSSTNVTANFFGVPGFQYTVERSTNLTQGLGWVPISTNIAPTNGLIQVVDNFLDLGIPIPPLPSSAYYRLRYNPSN